MTKLMIFPSKKSSLDMNSIGISNRLLPIAFPISAFYRQNILDLTINDLEFTQFLISDFKLEQSLYG